MRSTSQDETLEGKSSFEIRAETFGVKINRYHVDNGRFSEQYFRSSIEDYNQKIKFCGIVSHHQNAIFEGKIQTLTLRSIRLLPHKNIYWP